MRLCTCVVLGVLLLWGRSGAAPTPPNILFILADDFGHELLGSSGGSSYSTPALDRLAATGARFEKCFAQPLCTPTRVQLLTGLYNQRNYTRFGHLDPTARTFPQLLRQAGYRTCIVGKWQLGGGPESPARFGFDEHLLWLLSARGSRYASPVLERNGEVLRHHRGEYGPDLMTDELCGFFERNRGQPFFALYSMLLVHAPFEPTPASAAWDPRSPGAEPGQGDRRHFPDMVTRADHNVGKLLERLDALGIAERTLVIFTGDNGTPRGITSRLGGRSIEGGKGTLTEAGTHVPLLVRWPGVTRPGSVIPHLVDSTDFFPTVLAAAGLDPVPAGPGIDGRSFLGALRGDPRPAREWVYFWFAPNGGPTGLEAIRDERYFLHADGRLFDLESDPGGQRDLAGDPPDAARGARERLTRALATFRGTRREPANPPPAALEEAVESLRRQGAVVFRTVEGAPREVELNHRVVTVETLRRVGLLRELTDLSLEGTATNDAGLAELGGLERLEWLNLFRTGVGDEGLKTIGKLESLRRLPLGETGVTDAGLVHLAGLSRLEYLGLRGTRVSDAGLASLEVLPALRELHLGQTGVTDAAVAPLSRLKALRTLHLGGTKLSEVGLSRLREALPDCTIER